MGSAVADAVAEASSEFDEFSRTEQIPAFDLPTAAKESRWDEADLLELPPIENGRASESAAQPNPAAESESKQVVSLSPEQMDIIVQKIVDKLSERS